MLPTYLSDDDYVDFTLILVARLHAFKMIRNVFQKIKNWSKILGPNNVFNSTVMAVESWHIYYNLRWQFKTCQMRLASYNLHQEC